jgi:hypothetical protein
MSDEYKLIEMLAARGYQFTSHKLDLSSAMGHGKNNDGLTLEVLMHRILEGYPVAGVKGGIKLKNERFSLIVDADAEGMFQKLQEFEPKLALTLQTKGSKLGHFYVELDERVDKMMINLPDGRRAIDLLGHGAMAVLPPSLHRKTGKPYTIINDAEPIFLSWEFELKPALIKLCQEYKLNWVGVFPTEERVVPLPPRNEMVEQIKDKITLADFGLKPGLQSCPLPGHAHGDQSPSCSVSQDCRLYNCFSKHGGGDIFTFIMLQDGIEFREAKKRLAAKAGVAYTNGEKEPADDKRAFVYTVEDIPQELRIALTARAGRQVQPHAVQSILLTEPYPFTWAQVKLVSRLLTDEHDRAVVVLPKFERLGEHPLIRKEFTPNEYCTIDAQVVVNTVEGGGTERYCIADVYDCHMKNDEDPPRMVHHHWNLLFPGEPITKGYKKPDLGIRLGSYIYILQCDKVRFKAFSDKKLELGQIYRFGGMVVSAADKKNTHTVGFEETFMLVDWAVPSRELLAIDEDFFAKFHGLKHDEIRNSVAFPFENSVEDYMELPFASVFYIKSANIPLNITYIGPPGCTKSGFLERLAAISGDPYIDGGNTTIKGLMPSFSPKSQSPGAMATAHTFVLCNEFFDLMKNSQNSEDSTEIIKSMKTILEGKVATCRSGVGQMDIKMRGSAIFASNWLKVNKRDGYLTTVEALYGSIDPALLDRILMYPVPTAIQMKLKTRHENKVKNLMSRHRLETGEDDEIKILEKMRTPYKLNTIDLRTLIAFKEGLVAITNGEAETELIAQGEYIQREFNAVERYTRSQDFITNIASAYAFERGLVNGTVDKNTRQIEINREDIKEAAALYSIVLHRHKGQFENSMQQRKEFFRHGATKGQKFILETLKERFLAAGTEPAKASMLLDQLVMEYARVCNGEEWSTDILELISKRYILFDGEKLIWLHDELEPAALDDLFRGGEFFEYAEALLRHHLVSGNGIGGNLKHCWLKQLPIRPTDELQKLVVEALNAYYPLPATAAELRTKKPSLAPDQIENALMHMHLAGRLVRLPGGKYAVKP